MSNQVLNKLLIELTTIRDIKRTAKNACERKEQEIVTYWNDTYPIGTKVKCIGCDGEFEEFSTVGHAFHFHGKPRVWVRRNKHCDAISVEIENTEVVTE